ncbi:MAG: AAA family ATPase [Candidatus Bathyarchaeota archaeon]|nr:MAG: AAA family ATPase [Candidatus Bathyarchaeota archaeon]
MKGKKPSSVIHVSVRLPWHDRGWDGCVCNNPKQNVYCGGLRSVNAKQIRKFKYLDEDGNCKFSEKGVVSDRPPCTETINVFGQNEVEHLHIPPDFMYGKDVTPKNEVLPPTSSGTWPFESMWDGKGKPLAPDVRKSVGEEHFEKLTEMDSLVFYYCNYDNPITADKKKYLLVGIARLKSKRDGLICWPEIPSWLANRYGDFVWSWILQNNYPEEGVRIPYQEYLDNGNKPEDLDDIAVVIEDDLERRFKYVSRHLTNDDATVLIEGAIRAIKQVKKDGIATPKYCSWDDQIDWLDKILRECWRNRGLYPGLASTLAYCTFKEPATYIKELSKKLPNEDLCDYVFNRLEETPKKSVKIGKQEADFYANAKERYQALDPIVRKLCRECLPLFDLTDDQVANILGDHRSDFGISSSLETIYSNPYCICEEYVGSDIEDKISFYRIDNGMIPPAELGGKIERIPLDDPRRLRAMMIKDLETAGSQGHTFMDREDLFASLHEKHEESGRIGRFLFDSATWRQYQEFFTQKLESDQVAGLEAIFLEQLYKAERKIRNEIVGLNREKLMSSSNLDWRKIIEDGFKEKGFEQEPIDEAINQQVTALEVLYRARFAVLTGGAGVGKTTVLNAFVKGVHELDEDHQFLLLAPTGKASIVMRQKIGLEAKTIHSFLKTYKWLNPKNWTLKREGGKKAGGIDTVIIDEASMLDVELLATLFRALNWNEIERVIFVGDANQLPPIGPGKPFSDILDYIRSDKTRKKEHLAELTFNCRQSQGSQIAKLAAHYSCSKERPDEEVLWLLDSKSSSGDLVVRIWENEDELYEIMETALFEALYEVAKNKSIPALEELNKLYDSVHGLDKLGVKKDLEAVQVIAPYRHNASGVDPLNLYLQRLIRGDDAVRKFAVNGFVFWDKILQVRNVTYFAYDHDLGKSVRNEDTYVPNGTIGYVYPKRVNGNKIQAKFPTEFMRYSYYLGSKMCNQNLELGYVLSVHKSQGSQFTNTIFVLPDEDSDFLSRELLYTALTRAQGKLFLLLQNGSRLLKDRLWSGNSEIIRRNSALFKTAKGIPKGGFQKYRPEGLIYEVLPDLLVRSRAEVEISKALVDADIPFYYEKPLLSKDGQTFRLPDFTFKFKRKTYFWEHLGRLDDPIYAKDWERKRSWYVANGYENQLLTTPIEGLDIKKSIHSILQNRLGITV